MNAAGKLRGIVCLVVWFLGIIIRNEEFAENINVMVAVNYLYEQIYETFNFCVTFFFTVIYCFYLNFLKIEPILTVLCISVYCAGRGILIRITGLIFYVKIEDVTPCPVYVLYSTAFE